MAGRGGAHHRAPAAVIKRLKLHATGQQIIDSRDIALLCGDDQWRATAVVACFKVLAAGQRIPEPGQQQEREYQSQQPGPALEGAHPCGFH